MSNDVAMIEIRPGAGGDEAKIWADDLRRMYRRFAEKQGWQANVMEDSTLRIKGPDAFTQLAKEAGVHRVQRIPKTERYGRIHTSTATVAVLPEATETQVQINPADLEWQFFRSSTQGGQNVQKVSTAVRLKHKPTGLVVTCQRERSQEQNRQIALDLLRSKLWQRQQAAQDEKVTDIRRAAVGRAMRSEKIRTYNYPKSRVTDHRINKKWHNLEEILDGNLKKIITALTK